MIPPLIKVKAADLTTPTAPTHTPFYPTDARINAPELWIPGRKPVGNMKLSTYEKSLYWAQSQFNNKLQGSLASSLILDSNITAASQGEIRFNGTAEKIDISGKIPTSGDITIVCELAFVSNQFGYLYSLSSGASVGAILGIYTSVSSSNLLSVFRSSGNTDTVSVETSYTVNDSKFRSVTIRKRDKTLSMWVDGKHIGNATNTSNSISDLDFRSIGSRKYNSSRAYANGKVKMFLEVHTGLPDPLCLSLSKNPYQFLTPNRG